MDIIAELTQLNQNTGQARELEIALSNDPDEAQLVKLVPELELAKGFQQNHPSHYLDVYQHTLQVIKGLPNHSLLRITALFHDLGKIYSKVVDEDGVDHFWGHESKSVEIARRTMGRLGFSYQSIALIALLVQYHDTPIRNDDQLENTAIDYGRSYLQKLQEYQQEANESDAKDYGQYSAPEFKAIGLQILELLLQHQLSDLQAHSAEYLHRKEPVLSELLRRIKEIRGD